MFAQSTPIQKCGGFVCIGKRRLVEDIPYKRLLHTLALVGWYVGRLAQSVNPALGYLDMGQ